MTEGKFKHAAKVLHVTLCEKLLGFRGRRSVFDFIFVHFFQLALKCGMCLLNRDLCCINTGASCLMKSQLNGALTVPKPKP